MENIQKQHVCTYCDYKSVWKHNITRHMVTKHKQPNLSLTQPNLSPMQPNLSPTQPNLSPTQPNLSPENTTTTCTKCLKTFSYNWVLVRHSKICKGYEANALECQYCSYKFTTYSAKSRHLRICKVKKEIDSKAIVVVAAEAASSDIVPSVINQKINTIEQQILQQNNIEAQTNVQNQTINIIVYGEEISFKHDHMDAKEFGKKLVPGNKRIDPEILTRVVKDYTRELMANKSNQCVKKTNMKMSHSSIHAGGNKWESRQDKEVFPNMINNIANNFGDFLGTHFKPKIYKTLVDFLDYMASNGYCADDEDDKHKIIEDCYRNLCKELKLITYDFANTTVQI